MQTENMLIWIVLWVQTGGSAAMCRRQHRRFCEDKGDSIAAGQGALGRCERSGRGLPRLGVREALMVV